jgi:hypothetical protein
MPYQDAELADFAHAQRMHLLKGALRVIFMLGICGFIPMFLGSGYFGWQLMRYDKVDFHLVNTTDHGLIVTLDQFTHEIDSDRTESISFRAGQTHFTLELPDGTVLDSQDFYTDNRDVFYNLPSEERCYGVVDATAIYSNAVQFGSPPFTLVQRIFTTDDLYIAPHSIVVRPNGILPETIPGGRRLLWIEHVNCHLLETQNEMLLLEQLRIKMEGRQERYELWLQQTGG